MTFSKIYLRKFKSRPIWILCSIIILLNIGIVGLLQHYVIPKNGILEADRKPAFYDRATEGFYMNREKNNLQWIYSEAGSLQEKLKHFNDALSLAAQNEIPSNKEAITFNMTGQHTIHGQRPAFFKYLSKYPDVTTFLLSWYQEVSGNRTRTHARTRNTISSLLPVKAYYTCVIDEKFYQTLQYPSNFSVERGAKRNRNMLSQICSTDLSAIDTEVPFNPAYFLYHGMLPISIYEMAYYGRPPGLEEGGLNLQWNPPCLHCDRYPDFIAYASIIQGGVSVIDSTGKIYHADAFILPFSCLYAWNWDANITTYQKAFQNPNNLYSKVLVVSQQFDKNYYHNFAEGILKLVLYRDFLRQNPDAVIHTLSSKTSSEGIFIEQIVRMLGVRNKLVAGVARANVTVLPMGMGCLNPAVVPLQLGAKIIHEHILDMYGTEPPWDGIIVIKRNDRQFMEHSSLVHELTLIVNTSNTKLRILEFDGNNLPTLEDTMKMFYRAKIIIGSHGAGLTNMIFSRPGTVIIEANCHAPMGRPCYRNMAYKLGLRYYGQLTALTKDDGFRCANGLKIDFEAVKQVLKFLLNEVFA